MQSRVVLAWQCWECGRPWEDRKKSLNATVICNVLSDGVDPIYVWVPSHMRDALQITVSLRIYSRLTWINGNEVFDKMRLERGDEKF